MSPRIGTRVFLTGAVAVFLLMPAYGQRGGQPPSGGTAPPPTGGGNGPSPGSGPQRVPGQSTPQNSPTPRNNQPIFLSGRVTLEDGTPPPQTVNVMRVCNGNDRRIEGHTDARGYFSIELGSRRADSFQDASVGGFGAPGGPGGDPGFGGASSLSGNTGISENQLLNCELRADLAGYQSQTVSLAMRKAMDNPEIGVILLHRIGGSEGSTISATSLQAPKDAKKAFEKGEQLAKKNKLAEAQMNFEKAVQIYPRYAATWNELGRVQAATNQLDAAKNSFTESMKADSKYVPPYIQMSIIEASAKNWQGLAEVSERATGLDPFNYPQAFFFNAVANYNLHKMDAAEESARRAAKLDTRHQIPQVSHLLGVILADRQQYTAAAEQLRNYLQFAPGAQDASAVRNQLQNLEKLATSVPPNQQ